MKIEVKRKYKYPTSTLGEMYVDDVFFGYTLEDIYREKKVYGETCIPAKEYSVIVTYSNRFKVELPLLLNVEGFIAIRIHGGNTDKDTYGCILVGKKIDLKNGTISDCKERVSTITKMIKENKTIIDVIDLTF